MDQHSQDRAVPEVADTTDRPTVGPGRRMILRAGAAVPVGLGLTTLTACGSDDSGGFPTSDVPVGGATYDKDSETVYSQPTEGDFRAFDSTCPHQGCAVSEVNDGQMFCPCHGSTFDFTTGDVTAGPATTGLTPRQVTVNGPDLVLG